MLLRPVGGVAAGLIAAACSPRRVRTQIAWLGVGALPASLSEKALMLTEAVSALREEGATDACEELVCFIAPNSPPPEWHFSSSSSLFHPRPQHF